MPRFWDDYITQRLSDRDLITRYHSCSFLVEVALREEGDPDLFQRAAAGRTKAMHILLTRLLLQIDAALERT